MHRLSSLFFLTLFLATPLLASKEGPLPISTVTIKSDGTGSSGPVGLEARFDGNSLKFLELDAFNRKIIFQKNHIEQINEQLHSMPTSIWLSFESGYEELGGCTAYINFELPIKTSSILCCKVSISENGNIIIIKKLETK